MSVTVHGHKICVHVSKELQHKLQYLAYRRDTTITTMQREVLTEFVNRSIDLNGYREWCVDNPPAGGVN